MVGERSAWNGLPLRQKNCSEELSYCPRKDESMFVTNDINSRDDPDIEINSTKNTNFTTCPYNVHICEEFQAEMEELTSASKNASHLLENDRYGATFRRFTTLHELIPTQEEILSDFRDKKLDETVVKFRQAREVFRNLNVEMREVSFHIYIQILSIS